MRRLVFALVLTAIVALLLSGMPARAQDGDVVATITALQTKVAKQATTIAHLKATVAALKPTKPATATPKPTKPATATPKPTEATVAKKGKRCEDVPQPAQDAIATGIVADSGAMLRGWQMVKSKDYESVWFVAADLEGPSLDGTDQIAVWAMNQPDDPTSSLVLSVDGLALQFSDWGDGSTTDAHLSINDDGVSEAKDCVAAMLG